MEIRPITTSDLGALVEIDGAVESADYLHLERSGEGLATGWRLELRPLRQKLIDGNRLNDEQLFFARQIARGEDEGLALLAEHDGLPAAMLLARPVPGRGVLRILDCRVDSDFRRQGLGLVLIYQAIQHARQLQLRAVQAHTRTPNLPAAQLLLKAGFELAGLDAHRHSNHDMVKEAVTLIWYAALD